MPMKFKARTLRQIKHSNNIQNAQNESLAIVYFREHSCT